MIHPVRRIVSVKVSALWLAGWLAVLYHHTTLRLGPESRARACAVGHARTHARPPPGLGLQQGHGNGRRGQAARLACLSAALRRVSEKGKERKAGPALPCPALHCPARPGHSCAQHNARPQSAPALRQCVCVCVCGRTATRWPLLACAVRHARTRPGRRARPSAARIGAGRQGRHRCPTPVLATLHPLTHHDPLHHIARPAHSTMSADLASTYAALILADEGLEISVRVALKPGGRRGSGGRRKIGSRRGWGHGQWSSA